MRQSNSTFPDETRGASTFDAMMTRFSPRSRTNRLCVRCPRKGTSARGTTDAPVPNCIGEGRASSPPGCRTRRLVGPRDEGARRRTSVRRYAHTLGAKKIQ